MRPCSHAGQKVLRPVREGAGAVGIFIWRQVPFPSYVKVLGFDESESEM
jgi:hypothetical protein